VQISRTIRQSGRCAGRDLRNSLPEGNDSTSDRAERNRRVKALRMGSSSSTMATRGRVLLTSLNPRKGYGRWVLDLGPIRASGPARHPGALRVGSERKRGESSNALVQSRLLRAGTGRGPKTPDRATSRRAAGGNWKCRRNNSAIYAHSELLRSGPVAVRRPRTARRPGAQHPETLATSPAFSVELSRMTQPQQTETAGSATQSPVCANWSPASAAGLRLRIARTRERFQGLARARLSAAS